jgi:hypothetical protein
MPEPPLNSTYDVEGLGRGLGLGLGRKSRDSYAKLGQWISGNQTLITVLPPLAPAETTSAQPFRLRDGCAKEGHPC